MSTFKSYTLLINNSFFVNKYIYNIIATRKWCSTSGSTDQKGSSRFLSLTSAAVIQEVSIKCQALIICSNLWRVIIALTKVSNREYGIFPCHCSVRRPINTQKQQDHIKAVHLFTINIFPIFHIRITSTISISRTYSSNVQYNKFHTTLSNTSD